MKPIAITFLIVLFVTEMYGFLQTMAIPIAETTLGDYASAFIFFVGSMIFGSMALVFLRDFIKED